MTDPVDQFFEREREAVPTLSPPPGLFDELQTVARRKRTRHTTMVSAAAAVVVAVVGTGAVIGAQNLHGSTTAAQKPSAPTADKSVAAAPTPSAAASIAGVNAAVPTGFAVWSVSFYGSTGWALGGYACGTGQCAALLRTDNYQVPPGSSVMPQLGWRTVFKPTLQQTAQLGLTANTPSVRFGSPQIGWMVASGKVLSTRDGGGTWQPIDQLSSVRVTALETDGQKAFAVANDGKTLWVDTVATGTWRPTKKLALPAPATGTVPLDTIMPEGHVIVVTRTIGSSTTVRFSPIAKAAWQTISVPCGPASAAPLFVVTDENDGREVCGDGSVYLPPNKGGSAPQAQSLPAGTLAASDVVPGSITTDGDDTIAAYSGAGLVGTFDNGHSWSTVLTGSFRYVGLTDRRRGVALDASPSPRIWLSADGGRHWAPQLFR